MHANINTRSEVSVYHCSVSCLLPIPETGREINRRLLLLRPSFTPHLSFPLPRSFFKRAVGRHALQFFSFFFVWAVNSTTIFFSHVPLKQCFFFPSLLHWPENSTFIFYLPWWHPQYSWHGVSIQTQHKFNLMLQILAKGERVTLHAFSIRCSVCNW